MVTLVEVLISATPWGKFDFYRLLENAFTTIVDLKMLSDTDGHRKPQPKSPCVFMQIFLSIILLTLNSISSKIAFPWSHLHLELFQNFLL